MTKLAIHALGALGDGIADENDHPVFVPFSLPGEIVETDDHRPHAGLKSVVQPSAHRTVPPCRHFGTCGGCVAQHMQAELYGNWKRQIVVDAFAREGLDTVVEPLVTIPPHSRRRAVFSAHKDGAHVVLGFNRRGNDDIIDIAECPVLTPSIEAALPALRAVLATILRGKDHAQISVLQSQTGLDLDCVLPVPPGEDMLAAFVRAISRSSFVRASIDGDVVFERAPPVLQFGDAQVTPAPGAFVQAVAEAEAAIAGLVTRHLKPAKRVADLFAGSGTFSFPLARRAAVSAYEGDTVGVDAIIAAGQPKGHKPLTAIQRDLFDTPLSVRELNTFDGLCLDPPRAGAREQMVALAKSEIARIAYVSCNPTTLARDAAVLVKGGYKLETVVPVDQFVWSHHVEAVALFSKAVSKRPTSIFRKR